MQMKLSVVDDIIQYVVVSYKFANPYTFPQ